MSDRPAAFGVNLRTTREGLGWSLQDVAHRTRIPLATLRQLEDNDLSRFPSLAYAKSFLAQYSEHLGLDPSEWLDDFQTGDALANLDAYEYLKDHDEHIDAAPLTVTRRRVNPPKPKEPKVPSERFSRLAFLQPLLVFSVTALIITSAVFGVMKLSDKFSEDASGAAAEQQPEEPLVPVAGILEGRPNLRTLPVSQPALPDPSETLVAGDPNPARVSKTLNAPPTNREPVPAALTLETSPPPRAVIVEE